MTGVQNPVIIEIMCFVYIILAFVIKLNACSYIGPVTLLYKIPPKSVWHKSPVKGWLYVFHKLCGANYI